MAEQLTKVLQQVIGTKKIKNVVDVLEQGCSKKNDKPSKPNRYN